VIAPIVLAALLAAAADAPPAPQGHVDDRAGWLPADKARDLDDRLTRFEQQTGHVIVVAIFPELPSPSMEEFTVRTAQAWRIGRKGLDDGVVLFVFVKDRKLRIEVGYGLDAQVPDVVAKRIIDQRITPRLKAGDPAGGIRAGVEALIAAIQGRPPSAPAAAPIDADVPPPLAEPLNDPSGFLDAPASPRLRDTLSRAAETTGCRFIVTVYPEEPARYTGNYHDPDQFASRSLFRLYPIASKQSYDDYYRTLDAHPTGMLFVFIVERAPLAAVGGYFGSGACPREAVGRLVLDRVLLPRFPQDPAGALEAAVGALVEAAQGRWSPPAAPTPVVTPEPPVGALSRAFDAVVAFQIGGLPAGISFLVLAGIATIALPFAIRRSLKRRESFWYAWLMETLSIASHFVSSSGRTYSSSGSSSSSSSSSGRGGSFGGGGASGSW